MKYNNLDDTFSAVKNDDGNYSVVYTENGENVGYKEYSSLKNAKLGHRAGMAATPSKIAGCDAYETAAGQYAK